MKNTTILLGCILFFIFSPFLTFAADVPVAVAANFAGPMAQISARFTEKTGHKLIISYGATAKLYTQIRNGAPFEVFLSADQEHPRKLSQENQSVQGSQFTYAIGKLVLWSRNSKMVDSKGDVLAKGEYKHLSIANPKLAPYGMAARETLEKLGLWEELQPRLILGESISQAYQFVATGNAELGFVALAQVKQESKDADGSFWLVPQSLYSPLKEDALLLKNGRKNAAAIALIEFLKGDLAKTIIQGFGYELPSKEAKL